MAKSMIFILTALGASTAALAGAGQGYVLTAYSDAAGGSQLLSGEYSAALDSIRNATTAAPSSDVVRKTNACVAYTMLHRLKEARTACDAAVVAATADRSHAGGVVSKSRSQEDSAVAVAYSNRAVMHYLSRQAVGSAEDLAEAHHLAPESEYVVHNIAAFKQESRTPLSIGVLRAQD